MKNWNEPGSGCGWSRGWVVLVRSYPYNNGLLVKGSNQWPFAFQAVNQSLQLQTGYIHLYSSYTHHLIHACLKVPCVEQNRQMHLKLAGFYIFHKRYNQKIDIDFNQHSEKQTQMLFSLIIVITFHMKQ